MGAICNNIFQKNGSLTDYLHTVFLYPYFRGKDIIFYLGDLMMLYIILEGKYCKEINKK